MDDAAQLTGRTSRSCWSAAFDSPERLGWQPILAQHRLHVVGGFPVSCLEVTLEDRHAPSRLLASFIKPAQVRPFFGEKISAKIRCSAALSTQKMDGRAEHPSAHQFVVCRESQTERSDSEQLRWVWILWMLRHGAFDYVAGRSHRRRSARSTLLQRFSFEYSFRGKTGQSSPFGFGSKGELKMGSILSDPTEFEEIKVH